MSLFAWKSKLKGCEVFLVAQRGRQLNKTSHNLQLERGTVFHLLLTPTLCLDEPLESAKPLAAYGLDSLAAVEFRDWVRAQLGAELATLEVTSAPSLLSLTEKIVGKIQAANAVATAA
ncbi:Beta-ketoacyl synthase [Apiospora aurea]|uniref:Beta-ketoacyl synthase n=1 Tax=Apiospora aurea TaxID=335848 RepID=A0ABR1Q5I8_9PEZI